MRIPYHNATRARWAVAQAVAAWNSSGARVRFVPVDRRSARLLIVDLPGPAAAGFSFVGGQGTLGYLPPGSVVIDPSGRASALNPPNRVWLARVTRPNEPSLSLAGVVAHELGHVLGLEHEDRRCATMNSTLWVACSGARPCRLLEADDIRGAVRLYGGSVRLREPGFCPRPPVGLRAVGDPRAYSVTLAWRNPKGPLFDRVSVARGKGRCPTEPNFGAPSEPDAAGPGERSTRRDPDFVGRSGKLAVGRYCYALWSTSRAGAISRRKTIWIDFDPERVPPPSGLTAVLGSGAQLTVSWEQAAHPELEKVFGAVERDRCPVDPQNAPYAFESDPARPVEVPLGGPGRYCVVVWSRDSIQDLAGPTSLWVDYKGQPPSVSFDFGATGRPREVAFYDGSHDPDDIEDIVSRSWDFGDGAVLGGNERRPIHAYAAAGTYTVTMTATDAHGLTGTASRQVTVAR